MELIRVKIFKEKRQLTYKLGKPEHLSKLCTKMSPPNLSSYVMVAQAEAMVSEWMDQLKPENALRTYVSGIPSCSITAYIKTLHEWMDFLSQEYDQNEVLKEFKTQLGERRFQEYFGNN